MRTLSAWLAIVLTAAVTACAGGAASGAPPAGQSSGATPSLVFVGPSFPANPTGRQELFTSQLDGSDLIQLTGDGTIKFLPHFSPDGKQIVYTRFLSGGYGSPNPTTVVAVYDVATRKQTNLTSGGNADQPVWSPDGSRIAFSTYTNTGLSVMNADGSEVKLIGRPSGALDDMQWADPLWSSDNWIYFVVEQNTGGCLKVRVDRIRPDGTQRTQIDDGGPNCSLPGMEPAGDADPGISPDGSTLYSSRGLATSAPGLPGHTLRHLYSFSTQPYVPGKPEVDLTSALKPGCIAGVPKVSPAGTTIALFLLCEDDPAHAGVTLTDPLGSNFTFVEHGFGADWNPRR
jgi:hypothetical protein